MHYSGNLLKFVFILFIFFTTFAYSKKTKVRCDITNYKEYIYSHKKTDELINKTSKGCQLRGASLAGLNLTNASLVLADLRESDLRETKLGGSDLSVSDLRYTRLFKSDLRGANLKGVLLFDTYIKGADFERNRFRRNNL